MSCYVCNKNIVLCEGAYSVCPTSANVSAAQKCWEDFANAYWTPNCYISASCSPVEGSYLCKIPEPACPPCATYTDLASLNSCNAGCFAKYLNEYCSFQGYSSSDSGGTFDSSSSSAPYFDWSLAAQGMRESFDVFFTLFICFILVKLLMMVNK